MNMPKIKGNQDRGPGRPRKLTNISKLPINHKKNYRKTCKHVRNYADMASQDLLHSSKPWQDTEAPTESSINREEEKYMDTHQEEKKESRYPANEVYGEHDFMKETLLGTQVTQSATSQDTMVPENSQTDENMDIKVEMVIGPDLLKSLLPGLVEKFMQPSSQDEDLKYETEELWCRHCKMYCMDSNDLETHRKAHEESTAAVNSATIQEASGAVNHQADENMDFKVEMVIGPDQLKSLLPGLVENFMESSSQGEIIKNEADEPWCGPSMYCMDSKDLQRPRKTHENISPAKNSGILFQNIMYNVDTNPIVEEIIVDVDIFGSDQKPIVDELVDNDKKPVLVDLDQKPVVDELADSDQKPVVDEIIDIDLKPNVDEVIDIDQKPNVDGIIDMDKKPDLDKIVDSDPLRTYGKTCSENHQIIKINERESNKNADINRISEFSIHLNSSKRKLSEKSQLNVKKQKLKSHIDKPRRRPALDRKIPKHSLKNHPNKHKTVASKNTHRKMQKQLKKLKMNPKTTGTGVKATNVYKRPRWIQKEYFLCDACSKGFFDKENLIEHLRICSGTPKSDQKLGRGPPSDKLTQPSGLKLINCDICPRKFSNYAQLSLHKRLHRGDRTFCDICKIRCKDIMHHYRRCHRSKLLCDTCGETVDPQQLQYHKRKHDITIDYDTYVCHHCNKHITRKSTLVAHLKHYLKFRSCESTRYVCDICNKQFKTRNSIFVHVKTHLTRILPCYFCSRSFTRKDVWKYHMDKHKDDRLRNCNICNTSFAFKKQLRDHKKRVHKNQKVLCEICGLFIPAMRFRSHGNSHQRKSRCEVCKKKFFWKSNFMSHLRLHAANFREDDSYKIDSSKGAERIFYCDYCGRKFVFKKSIVKHLLLYHTNTADKPYICKICNKSFQDNRDCLTHKRLHIGEKEFGCDLCEKSFSTKAYLTSHRRYHTGELFSCSLCPKKYNTIGNLRTHMENHCTTGHELKENFYTKKFNCDICSKRFATKSMVAAHKCIRTEDKIISCESCNNRFRKVTDLAFHRCPGIKIKAIVCRICNKHFSKKSNLRSHSKREHDLDVFTCDHCNMLFPSEHHLSNHQRR